MHNLSMHTNTSSSYFVVVASIFLIASSSCRYLVHSVDEESFSKVEKCSETKHSREKLPYET